MCPRWTALLSGTLFFAAIAVTTCVVAGESAKDTRASAEQTNVSCRVLESHTSAERGVTIVIFHQSAKEDQGAFQIC